jgi:ABC-2 type transport system permease protein
VYLGIQDLADKLKNFSFIIGESLLLFFIFKPEVVIPSIVIFSSVIGLVLMATLLNFFISLLFGSLGFWSPDTWAPRFLFYMFVEFTAGRLFPLDILPKTIQQIVFLTPFPYLSFIQTQLFLGKIPTPEIGLHFAILSGWLLFFFVIVRMVWSKGLKDYSATGQ